MKHTIDGFHDSIRRLMDESGFTSSQSLESLHDDDISMRVFIALDKYIGALQSPNHIKPSCIDAMLISMYADSMHDRHMILADNLRDSISSGYSAIDGVELADDDYMLSFVPLAVDTLIGSRHMDLITNGSVNFNPIASLIPTLMGLDMLPDDEPDMRAIILRGVPITRAVPVWKNIASAILTPSTDSGIVSMLVSMIEIKRNDYRADESKPMKAAFQSIMDGYRPSRDEYYLAAHQFINCLVDNKKKITEDSRIPLSFDIYGSPHMTVALLKTYVVMKHRILGNALVQTYHRFYENSSSPSLYSMMDNHNMICLSIADMMANIHRDDSITICGDADFILESLMMGTVGVNEGLS